MISGILGGEGQVGISSWDGVHDACTKTAARLKAARTTGRVSQATEWIGRSRSRMGLVLGVIGGVAVAIVGLLLLLSSGGPPPRVFDEVESIRPGELTLPDGPTVQIERFWLEAHEATIHEYASFLADLDVIANPTAFDHADQPSSKEGHAPANWASLLKVAKKGGVWNGHPIDLNHPVTGIDWWDAHAFAKWKNGRLPTLEEWSHAAAAGFPWGEAVDPALTNRSGTADGFSGNSPVDALSEDRTKSGVYGMAGNVSEWSGSMRAHPRFPDRRIPVVMGASHQSAGTDAVDVSIVAEHGERQPSRGVRVAYDRQP